MKNKKKTYVIISSIVVILLLLITLVILPLYHLYQGNTAYAKAEYDVAIQQYAKALGYGNASEKINSSYYEKGKINLSFEEYEQAIENFKNANGYEDADKLLEDIALNLIKNKNYSLAITAYEIIKNIEQPTHYNYAIACSALEDENDYKKAIETFNLCLDVEEASEKIKVAYYKLGKSNVSEKEYIQAKENFTMANGYEDSAYMINVCDFLRAEDLWYNGSYESAVEIYKNLPRDFSYEDINVNNKINGFNNYKKLKELEGYYETTSSDYHVKQVHRSTGIWNGWDNTGSSGSFEIEVSLLQNGNVKIHGSAEGRRYTNYSSISSSLRDSTFGVIFNKELTTNTLSPGVLESYDSKTLKYNGNNKFTLSLNEVDNSQDVYFKYVYTSNFVFTKQ